MCVGPQVPVRAPQTVAGHVRGRPVLAGHRVQTGHDRHEHPPAVPRPLLPVLHGLHGAAGAHQPHQHPVRRRPTVLRGHQQVRGRRQRQHYCHDAFAPGGAMILRAGWLSGGSTPGNGSQRRGGTTPRER